MSSALVFWYVRLCLRVLPLSGLADFAFQAARGPLALEDFMAPLNQGTHQHDGEHEGEPVLDGHYRDS